MIDLDGIKRKKEYERGKKGKKSPQRKGKKSPKRKGKINPNRKRK